MASSSYQELKMIDGSMLEGGGQILRNSIALSALLQKPVRIEKIRQGRSQPGLRNQHRTGLELAAKIADAQLTGAINGSTEIEFRPGSVGLFPGFWKADSITAGATTLLLQIAFPIVLFKSSGLNPYESPPLEESVLRLLGGTNGTQAPQADYAIHVFMEFFKRHFLPTTISTVEDGAGKPPNVELKLKMRGYHPKGGGELQVRVRPLDPGQTLKSIKVTQRGKLKSIRGIAHYAGLPNVVGEGMRDGALKLIKDKLRKVKDEIIGCNGKDDVEVDIEMKREPRELTIGAGSGMVLWAEFENGVFMGGSSVGRKGLESLEVGRVAVEELFEAIENGGCVDEWLQDQIIIFMALAEGQSEVWCGKKELSLHTRTAIWVAEQMTDAKFEVEQGKSGVWIIRCQGIGFKL